MMLLQSLMQWEIVKGATQLIILVYKRTAFEGSFTTFKGLSNVSYNTNLLTFVTIDVNTCISV